MRNLSKQYSILDQRTLIVEDIPQFDIQDLRLIVNETQGKVLCSSLKKNKVTSVALGELPDGRTAMKIIFADAVLTRGDILTIEVAKPLDLSSLAKEQSLTTATAAIMKALSEGGSSGDSPYSKWTAEQLGYDGTPTEYEVISQDEVDGMINEAWSTTFGKADPEDPSSKDFQYICDMADALLYGDIQQSAQDAVEELMKRLRSPLPA